MSGFDWQLWTIWLGFAVSVAFVVLVSVRNWNRNHKL